MKRLSLRALQLLGKSAKLFLTASLFLNFATVLSMTTAQNLSTIALQNKSASRERLKPAPQAAIKKPLLIAHRGASAYAPEHTLLAYKLAIEQGADFVEQDLQITKDGVLVCLHDPELSRTTNVREVFPERATLRDTEGQGTAKKGWYVADFTLAEIKQLDAGSWFNQTNPFAAKPEYKGQKVPTLAETIKAVNFRAGLYIELKDYEYYKSLGFEMAKMTADVLKASGYAKTKRSKQIFIQSFVKEALLKMREVAPLYPRVQLLPMEDGRRSETAKITSELAKEYAEYAQGVGPAKQMLTSVKDVEILHAAGLVIHPFTFRGTTNAVLRKPLDETQKDNLTERQKVIADIQRYLAFGIDGGFTDYPALWKEAVRSMKQ